MKVHIFSKEFRNDFNLIEEDDCILVQFTYPSDWEDGNITVHIQKPGESLSTVIEHVNRDEVRHTVTIRLSSADFPQQGIGALQYVYSDGIRTVKTSLIQLMIVHHVSTPLQRTSKPTPEMLARRELEDRCKPFSVDMMTKLEKIFQAAHEREDSPFPKEHKG